MKQCGAFAAVIIAGVVGPSFARAALEPASPDAMVLDAQRERIEAIARASKAAIAIYNADGGGGGSGVIISADGYALTNFHVVVESGAAMKCGLPDGLLYDAVIVGVDPVGDVALVQLLGRDDFPVAEIGDSDRVRVGDWVFAAGNPFLLAEDFTPSISYGIVSGVQRYQEPARTLLEYTDCIQTDAAINPGNSGGPLFDAEGRLIGVNGRASFEKRGRVNVGVGYAISINQAMRFLSHLKSGRIVDHATLGATVSTDAEGRVIVEEILDSSDAYRRGLRYGDQIVRFAGREINTANALKNALGVFPRGWKAPLSFLRNGERRDVVVRMAGVHAESELIDLVQNDRQRPNRPRQGEPKQHDQEPSPDDQPEQPDGAPQGDQEEDEASMPEAVGQRYVARRGYANYWYNAQMQKQLWQAYFLPSTLEDAGYAWTIDAKLPDGSAVALETSQATSSVRLPWGVANALFEHDPSAQLSPPGSGGLLLAVHLWQRLLDKGLRQFGEVYYLGQLPAGLDGRLCECLVGIYAGVETRFCFSPERGELTAIEMFPFDDVDPCELSLLEYEEMGGRRLPRRWVVRHGDEIFADVTIQSWQFDLTADGRGETPATAAEQ